MNILIINSRYRKDGNTDRTAQLLQARLQLVCKDNHEPLVIDTLYLGHMNLEPCRGCRVCFDKGEEFCPIKDDMAAVKARMKAADAIILAGPVYVDDVNGIMKNWIDRLARSVIAPSLWANRPTFWRRWAARGRGMPCGRWIPPCAPGVFTSSAKPVSKPMPEWTRTKSKNYTAGGLLQPSKTSFSTLKGSIAKKSRLFP